MTPETDAASGAESLRPARQRVSRNAIYNLVGETVPILAALLAIPVLIRSLGTDRFGLLTIVWMVIGYFGLFDFGLGRALTKIVAEKLGAGRPDEVPALVWTALAIMLALGVIGMAIVAAVSPVLVHRVIKMPAALQPETLRAFELLAVSIPVVICSSGLRGCLEGMHRFDLVNAVRTPMGIFSFVGPLLVLPFSTSLVAVVLVLLAGRVVTCLVYLSLLFRTFPAVRRAIGVNRSAIRPLFRFGSWMTVSNLASPLMTTFDRFIVGMLLSTQAVAYYATPYDVTAKLLVIPGALAGALFPTFSAEFASDPTRVRRIFGRSIAHIFLVLFPVTLAIVALAHEGLQLWLGPEFARASTPVLQLLAAGILVNSLAFVPLALIQAVGRPDLAAKLHMVELPLYLVAIYGLIEWRGIDGAAIASVARITVDAIGLFVMAWWLLRFRIPVKLLGGLAAGALLLFAGLSITAVSPVVRVVVLLLALGGFAIVAWLRLLAPEERMLLVSRVRAALS